MPTTDELNAEVRCLTCAGLSQYQSISLAFYQRWLLALNPSADVSLNGLTAYAACYACLGLSLYETLQIAMLDQIAQLEVEAAAVASIVDSFAARAEITDESQLSALTTLVTSARANGWWDKCDLIYPFVGGTAGAHAQNLKSSSFPITWAGTVTHDANGITGDGATGYGDTGYIPSSSGQIGLDSVHGSVYRRTTGTLSSRNYFGSGIPGTALACSRTFSSTTFLVLVHSGSSFQAASTSLGLAVCSRLDAAVVHVFNAGLDKSGAVASIQIPNVPLFVLAQNSSGTPASWINANLAFLTIGSGITFAEYQVMASDIQTFQLALGRAV